MPSTVSLNGRSPNKNDAFINALMLDSFLGEALIAMPPTNDAMMLMISWAKPEDGGGGFPFGLSAFPLKLYVSFKGGGLTWGLRPSLQAWRIHSYLEEV